MSRRPARAVLFDLDDTLTPRRAGVRNFALMFASDYAGQLEPMPIEELAAKLIEIDRHGYNPRRPDDLREQLPWRAAPSAEVLEKHWLTRFPQAVMPQPDLHEALAALAARGLAMGVVTNGGVVGQNAKIDRLRVREHLQAIVISEGVGCKKPDPRIFEIACAELSVEPQECWFVGDHPENDVLGATRFGMTGVWINVAENGRGWPDGLPDPAHQIERLGELEALIDAAAR